MVFGMVNSWSGYESVHQWLRLVMAGQWLIVSGSQWLRMLGEWLIHGGLVFN